MSVNRKVTVPVGSGAGRAAGSGAGASRGACRRRRSSRPSPSSIAATPSTATTLHRMPVGVSRALPEPVHSAAATATAMMPLTTVVVITPRFSPRSAGRRSPARGSPGCGGPTRPPPFERLRPHEHSPRGVRATGPRCDARPCRVRSRRLGQRPYGRGEVLLRQPDEAEHQGRRQRDPGHGERHPKPPTGRREPISQLPSPARSQRVGQQRQNTETTTTRTSSPMGHQKLVSLRHSRDEHPCPVSPDLARQRIADLRGPDRLRRRPAVDSLKLARGGRSLRYRTQSGP